MSRTSKAPRPGPIAVTVLGMHRSGTSLVTRVVNLCGVDVDDPEALMGPSADNERGYWEPRYLAETNEAILEAQGGAWCAPPFVPVERWRVGEELRGRMESAVAARRTRGRAWVWKDPRMTLTLPCWRPWLEPTISIVCIRNPAEVAASLQRRDAFTREGCHLLWEAYMRSALRVTEGLPRHFIRYEDLITNAEETIEALVAFLEKAGIPGVQSTGAARNEAMASLRHHDEPRSAFLEDPLATPSQKNLFETLTSATPGASSAALAGITTPDSRIDEIFSAQRVLERQRLAVHELRSGDSRREELLLELTGGLEKTRAVLEELRSGDSRREEELLRLARAVEGVLPIVEELRSRAALIEREVTLLARRLDVIESKLARSMRSRTHTPCA